MAADEDWQEALVGNQAGFIFEVEGLDIEIGVVRWSGTEEVSGLFEFRLELAVNGLDTEDFVGKHAALTITGVGGSRQIHGLICLAEQVGDQRQHSILEVTLVPDLWKLQQRTDVRMFQDQTTPEILLAVLVGGGVPRNWIRLHLTATYAPRDYCVQYRESDFDFVSRLMEEDGIHYYFEHHEDRHILVLSDHGARSTITGAARLWVSAPQGFVRDQEHINNFRISERIRSGKVTLRDHNLHRPDQPMEASEQVQVNPDLERYDYPGEYQDPGAGTSPHRGGALARMRLIAAQAERVRGLGASDCARLTPGFTFHLVGHPHVELDDEYWLLRVVHRGEQPQALEVDADGEFHYSNEFVCIHHKQPYRPPQRTPKPHVRGVQTATVVGPPGEEIHVDAHGRVKVQFHWDRRDRFDDSSSCWVRVSQPWAGNAWGGIFIPRIGHEVVVDFIEGDPDRPLITGRIYHGNNHTPYPLPDHKTKSTIKSETYLGGGGFNELRFEDRRGAEQVFLHAQRDLDIRVLHDRMETVLHDRHLSVGAEASHGKEGDFREYVARDRSIRVDRDHDEHVGGDMRLHVGGVDGTGHFDTRIEGTQRIQIVQSAHRDVGGDQRTTVHGEEHVQVLVDSHRRVGGLEAIEAGQEVHIKAPVLVLEATQGFTVKGPGGFITINAEGVFVEGIVIKLNSGGPVFTGRDAAPKDPELAVDARPVPPKAADTGEV